MNLWEPHTTASRDTANRVKRDYHRRVYGNFGTSFLRSRSRSRGIVFLHVANPADEQTECVSPGRRSSRGIFSLFRKRRATDSCGQCGARQVSDFLGNADADRCSCEPRPTIVHGRAREFARRPQREINFARVGRSKQRRRSATSLGAVSR